MAIGELSEQLALHQATLYTAVALSIRTTRARGRLKDADVYLTTIYQLQMSVIDQIPSYSQ